MTSVTFRASELQSNRLAPHLALATSPYALMEGGVWTIHSLEIGLAGTPDASPE